jgi:hypothetical protein
VSIPTNIVILSSSSVLVVFVFLEKQSKKPRKKRLKETMKILLQQIAVLGPAKKKYLAPSAAASLKLVEKESGGLVYSDVWQDSVAVLIASRISQNGPRPGYSSHQFGLGVDLDLTASLDRLKISYPELLKLLEKNFWYCYRRDGEPSLCGSEHFDYFGEKAWRYVFIATNDHRKWNRAAEERIYELYGDDFKLSVSQVQSGLSELGIYALPVSGELDAYTREALMVFQRAWKLPEDGTANMSTCRVLSVLTADLEIFPVAW